MRGGLGALPFHSPQQRAVADSSRTKNNIFAVGQVVGRKDALEIFFAAIIHQFLSFLLVARPHLALHFASETFDSRRGQHRFWRTANAHVKIDVAFR